MGIVISERKEDTAAAFISVILEAKAVNPFVTVDLTAFITLTTTSRDVDNVKSMAVNGTGGNVFLA